MYKSESKWHHQITHFPELSIDGFIHENKKTDNFCEYTRWFLWKLLIVIPATVMITGGVLGWYVSGLAAFLTPSITFFNQGSGYQMWITIHLVFLFIIALGFLITTYETWSKGRKIKKSIELQELELKYESGELERPPHGFLKTWYLSFKEKYCPKMEY
jgi:uncharacterized membrane protein